jgi:hypothetical protein
MRLLPRLQQQQQQGEGTSAQAVQQQHKDAWARRPKHPQMGTVSKVGSQRHNAIVAHESVGRSAYAVVTV